MNATYRGCDGRSLTLMQDGAALVLWTAHPGGVAAVMLPPAEAERLAAALTAAATLAAEWEAAETERAALLGRVRPAAALIPLPAYPGPERRRA